MTASDRDHRARRVDTRSGQEAFVDRSFQAEDWSSHIADSGEAAHQRGGRLGPS
jgi:hypothetical protein